MPYAKGNQHYPFGRLIRLKEISKDGTPYALKGACTVWSGEKAEITSKPYLSLYTDFDARISIRLDSIENFKTFEVGTYGLCIMFGDEISGGLYCHDCESERHVRCDQCGEYCTETYSVYNRECEEIEVCASCLDEHYTQCDDCGEYYHVDDGCLSLVYDADGCECYVCENCREDNYEECEHCHETCHESLMHVLYDKDGNELRVCCD